MLRHIRLPQYCILNDLMSQSTAQAHKLLRFGEGVIGKRLPFCDLDWPWESAPRKFIRCSDSGLSARMPKKSRFAGA
jgi:hypothetical protein